MEVHSPVARRSLSQQRYQTKARGVPEVPMVFLELQLPSLNVSMTKIGKMRARATEVGGGGEGGWSHATE